jgi:hypothetical protein
MCALLLPPGVNRMCAVLLPPGVKKKCAVLLTLLLHLTKMSHSNAWSGTASMTNKNRILMFTTVRNVFIFN